jgi:UDP-glucose 4-epimerase
MRILVTGGAGYIGSHTCVELLLAGHDVIAVDNLYNSQAEVLDRVSFLGGVKLQTELKKSDNIKGYFFIEGDVRDSSLMDDIFSQYNIDIVVHFAGLKAVGESANIPLDYYDNNVQGTLVLCKIMQKYNVKRIVFSSSATVYGAPSSVPVNESSLLSATNPYGRSKLFIEEVLQDLYKSDPEWKVVILRYFNPVGAHKSGLIGDSPSGTPNNLMPYICDVASGKREKLFVFGSDYSTKDGFGVRDYIHVVDLAKAHISGVNYTIDGLNNKGVLIANLGTGQGYSVLEMIEAFKEVSNQEIPFEVVGRRKGDVAECYADPLFAIKTLNWSAKLGLKEMCRDSWNFQCKSNV